MLRLLCILKFRSLDLAIVFKSNFFFLLSSYLSPSRLKVVAVQISYNTYNKKVYLIHVKF